MTLLFVLLILNLGFYALGNFPWNLFAAGFISAIIIAIIKESDDDR